MLPPKRLSTQVPVVEQGRGGLIPTRQWSQQFAATQFWVEQTSVLSAGTQAQINEVSYRIDSAELDTQQVRAEVAALKGDERLQAAPQALEAAIQALSLSLSRQDARFQQEIGELFLLVNAVAQQVAETRQRQIQMAQEAEQAARQGELQSLVSRVGESVRALYVAEDAVAATEDLADTVDGLTTADIPEGGPLYFTDERVDDRVSALVQNGGGLTWTYNDGAGTLTAAVSINDGNWSGADLAIANGGTGSSSASAARTALGLEIGTNVQAFDADLGAVAGLASNGLIVRTGSGTAAARTLTGTANELTVTNGDGVSGNPTLSLPTALTFTGKTVSGGTLSGVTLSGATTGPGGFNVDASGFVTGGGTNGWAIGAKASVVRIDYNGTAFRALNAGGGLTDFTMAGLIATSLRVNVAPTAAAVAQTHHIPINVNGTAYKLLLAT